MEVIDVHVSPYFVFVIDNIQFFEGLVTYLNLSDSESAVDKDETLY